MAWRPTNVAEGVYLLALQLDMPGYGTTKPIFIVPGTYGLVSTSLPNAQHSRGLGGRERQYADTGRRL